MKNKRWLYILIVVLLLINLTACTGGSSGVPIRPMDSVSGNKAEGFTSDYSTNAIADYDYTDYDDYEDTNISETSSNESVRDNRKLITTYNLDVETKEYDVFVSWIVQEVNSLGGYVEQSNSYAYTDTTRNMDLVIRLPASKDEAFIESISEKGNVTRNSKQEEDVTLSYTDIESHKEALVVEQERLMELLKNAETLDDILSLEDRLSTIRYQLDYMESALRTYDNQIDYSTIYVDIEEVKVLTEVAPEKWLDRLKTGFLDNCDEIGTFFSELILFILTHILSIIILAGFIVVLVIFIKKINKRQQEKVTKFRQQLAEASRLNPPDNKS